MKQKKSHKLWKYVGAALIGIMVCVLIIDAFALYGTKKNSLSLFGYKLFVVLSNDMQPSLKKGDLIIIDSSFNIRKNDMVSFRRNGCVVTHRITDIQYQNDDIFYKTKADSNIGVDIEVLQEKDIEGKYITKIPIIGIILLWMVSNWDILLLIFLLVMVSGMFFYQKAKKTSKEKEA